MDMLLQDLRYSFRTMVRSPGFVSAAVISLALGIGPNTMVFSLINALLLRPLPVDKPDQLVRVIRDDGSAHYQPLSYPDYVDYRDRQQVFTGLAACQRMMFSLNVNGQPIAILGAVVSTNFFSVLGVQPSLGRAFGSEEDQSLDGNPVTIISYNLWRQRFNADPALLGRTLRLNGQVFTVVGVAPKGFIGVDVIPAADIWIPIRMYTKLTPSNAAAFDPIKGREIAWIDDVIGRLKPGVSRAQAQSNLGGISKQLDGEHPSGQTDRRRVLSLFPIRNGHPSFRAGALSFAMLLLAITGLVLLITCANVANLLLTRAAGRHREIAIRLAMGAGRWRLIRQLFTESVVLALAGGVVGLVLAYWASDLLLTFKPSVSVPITVDLSLDQRVLGFSLAITLLTGVAFGLAPALQTSRPDLVPALKADTVSLGRGAKGSWLHSLFVVVQMALSLALLIGGVLLHRSIQNAYEADPGFEKKKLMMLSTDLDLRGYEAGEAMQLYRKLIDRVQAVPGLRSASLTNLFPLSFASATVVISVEGHESQYGGGRTVVGTSSVAPKYFETMNIPLVQGRDFSYNDVEAGPKVIIINQIMANRFWPGENPIGKRLNFDPYGPKGSYYEVIGVAKDSKFGSLEESPQPFVYMCILQQYSPSITLVARTESDPERLLNTVRREVQSLDGDLTLFNVKTATEHMNLTLFPLRAASTLLGLLGALALLLASVGLYAVIAYSVTLRTREIGVRLALGARPVQILKHILKRGAFLSTIGMVLGQVLAFALAHVMSKMGLLHGIGAIDPASFFGVSVLLFSVAVLASYIPARRATRIDPVITLRQG